MASRRFFVQFVVHSSFVQGSVVKDFKNAFVALRVERH